MASSVRGVPPRVAAAIAVGVALIVAAVWWTSAGSQLHPVASSAREATVAVRITRHDTLGAPVGSSRAVREPAKVGALVDALGVDDHPPVACPPDYATADVGLVLSGRDVYERRNVWIWNLAGDGGAPFVLTATSSGCRGGPPVDDTRVREILGTGP